ncbi:MAG: YccF domain-containing protein [Gemmatimonadaceae bacterium]
MPGGVLLAISIVGPPFAFAAFRIAGFAAFPFGKQLVDARQVGDTRIINTDVANILWFVFAGVWLFIAHVAVGIEVCLTIIGIPFGLAHFKLAMVSLAPLVNAL